MRKFVMLGMQYCHFHKTFEVANIIVDAYYNGEQQSQIQLYYAAIIRLGYKQYPDGHTKDLLTCL